MVRATLRPHGLAPQMSALPSRSLSCKWKEALDKDPGSPRCWRQAELWWEPKPEATCVAVRGGPGHPAGQDSHCLLSLPHGQALCQHSGI